MKLPLRIQCDYNTGRWRILDAGHQQLCELQNIEIKFASALVKKFNRNWRWRLFGAQPYEYSREDWLGAQNPCGNRVDCMFNRGILGRCFCKEHFEKGGTNNA